MHLTGGSVAALFVVSLPAIAAASVAPMYVTDSVNQIWTVDVDSGQTELVNSTFAQYTDIAFDPQNRLFGITSTHLYEIDLATAWNTQIGPHGFGVPGSSFAIDALTYGSNGVLYAAGDDILLSIDPATGVGTRLGNLSGYRSAGDLASDLSGRLFLTTDVGDLVEVLADGSGANLIGDLPYDDVYALAGSPDGNLYGLRSNNDVVSINTSTGHATTVATSDSDFLIGRAWGGSFPDQFIPEPATLLLMLPGLAVLWRRRDH